jgi:hypothetical protein
MLDSTVERTCQSYLELADHHAPGLVQGLYLAGSVALGDYRPGVSDIDFVAVTARPADPEVLRTVHKGLRSRHPGPFFDGLYLRYEDLQRDPELVPPGPAVQEWRLEPESRFERNLVTWHVLAQGGVAVRGPAVENLAIYTDWPALAGATRRNLVDYWTPWLARGGRGPTGLTRWACAWGVLGVARLRHTLAAGRITTKTEAASYALEVYDERWHRVVREALRIRVGGRPLYRNPWRRRADLVGFVGDALRAPG